MNDKLIKIQQELNAPKNLFNSFGGYSYRSAESILEAVKPLLKKYNCSLLLGDKIVNVGEFNYVKSTATLATQEENVSVTAYAREAKTKKGMDDAQITGSASSYARKYALNGLFAIDDTKDPDTNEHRQERSKKPTEGDLSKAKQSLFKAFKDKGITDSVEMMGEIQKATGKDVVESVEDVNKVIENLKDDVSS